MIDWMMVGALAAVLTAELVDAWALHQLSRRCAAVGEDRRDRERLVRWYAEGFEHSRAIAGWLRAGSLVLAVLSIGLGAHPLVIVAALALAVAAHGECRYSTVQRQRYLHLARRFGGSTTRTAS